MSRARPLAGMWFDQRKNNDKASPEQLELLAAVEDLPLDDLLDEGLTQAHVITRLRETLQAGLIPQEVLERRRAAKEAAGRQPECRICSEFGWECQGAITRHHFMPRWMMLQLDNYQAYAARSRCTIPICVGRHRDLHLRGDTETPKSIAQFLNERERAFAQKMMGELREQHPAIFDLIAAGDSSYTYESQLIQDYIAGRFKESAGHAVSAGQSSQATA